MYLSLRTKKIFCFDAELLFINIPIKAIKHFICEEIYVHKKLKPICKNPIFKNNTLNEHLVLQKP